MKDVVIYLQDSNHYLNIYIYICIYGHIAKIVRFNDFLVISVCINTLTEFGWFPFSGCHEVKLDVDIARYIYIYNSNVRKKTCTIWGGSPIMKLKGGFSHHVTCPLSCLTWKFSAAKADWSAYGVDLGGPEESIHSILQQLSKTSVLS